MKSRHVLFSGQEIELNAVTNFSSWPSKLLAIDCIGTKNRTAFENMREYNLDKWGTLYEKLLNGNISSIDKCDKIFLGESSVVSLIDQKLFHLNTYLSRKNYNYLIQSYLESFGHIENIVELGAGYGSVLLSYMNNSLSVSAKTMGWAFEYTENGRKCIEHLSKNLNIQVDSCDFMLPGDFPVLPENAIVFTSAATIMIPELQLDLFNRISLYKPKMVIHFEPILQLYEPTLLGLLQRQYLSFNHYNSNLFTLLEHLESQKTIKIIDKISNFYGENFLLPCSLIAWKPLE